MSGCTACGRRLWFSERVAHPSQFCFGCSQARGIRRLADAQRFANLHREAAPLPPWWRWTVFVSHAVHWSQPSPLDEPRASSPSPTPARRT